MDTQKKTKIALFGGSFDPPHYGHYDIVKNLEKSFDRVIVVPSNISPFKTGAADGAARLKLCKKLFTSEKTEVSNREIRQKGISYSVDTAAYFAKKYPTAQLFFVIGSEELTRLCEWHDIDRLKKLVTFYVVARPGFAPDADTVAKLKKLKVKIKNAKFTGLDISSTRIKIDLAFGKSNSFLPSAVYEAVKKTGIFNDYAKYVNALYKYDLTDKRITHTYGVAVRGAELAKLYGGNVHDAVVACLLHDIAKSVDPDDYKNKVDVKGFPMPTVHSAIGAYIARREFGVSDEIEHAIRYHSTGDGEMSLLDEIVYLADKTEAGRNYSEVYYFRYLCSIDKDAAMYKALCAVSEYKETRPCEYTTRAIELYESRLNGRKIPELPPRPKYTATATEKLPAVNSEKSLVITHDKSIKTVEQKDKSVKPVIQTDKSVRVTESTDIGGDKSGARRSEKVSQSKDASPSEIADAVADELILHKAHDVDIIDLSGKTIIADYFIIASATSSTAVKALCDYVEEKMTKTFGTDPFKRDVDREWAALDYGCVIVHVFTDRMREFYNIERLWSDGTNVRRIDK